MKKVVFGNSRTGDGHCKRRKISVQNPEDNYPTKISARRDAVGSGDPKEELISTGPIKRYLRKQVGRNWSTVWSEICQHNKDFCGQRLKNSIKWYVEVNCYFDKKGNVVGAGGVPITGFYSTSFYVHPTTNILMSSN